MGVEECIRGANETMEHILPIIFNFRVKYDASCPDMSQQFFPDCLD
jgi:hypothetical protein